MTGRQGDKVTEKKAEYVAPNGLLTRDQIMAFRNEPRRTMVVEVPEWGGSVTLQEMTARERDAFEASTVDGQGKKMKINIRNLRARLVAACAVGADGQPLFYPTDVEMLGDLSASALSRVFDVARELNGMTEEDVEEMAGN